MCVYSEGGSEVNWFNVATQNMLVFLNTVGNFNRA